MSSTKSHFHSDSPAPTILATAIGLTLASAGAFAQEQQPAAADIVVTGKALGDVTSSKFTAPIIDTPKSVTVITQALITATGANSLVDALRTVPGITFNAGEGGQPAGDNLKIRGFDAGADVFIDGVRDAGSQTRDVFALEQIEVVKGPGSAYSGRGSSGGSVNLVTKKPGAEQFFHTSLAAGTDSYGRAALDANYAISDSVAFRLNLLRQDFDVPGRNGVSNSHWGVAPALALGLGEDTRFNFDYYRYETDDIPDYSIPYARNETNTAPAGEPIAVDRETFYGLLNRDFQRSGSDIRTFQFAHDFPGGLTVSNVARYGRTSNDYIVTNPDDGRGNVPNGFVLRNTKSRNSETTTEANLTDFSGRATLGGIEHSFAFGVELGREAMTNRPYSVEVAFNGNAVSSFDNSCSAPGAVGATSNYNCTTIDNPNPYDPWTGAISQSTTPTEAQTETRSIYGFDTLALGERWLLNVGLRWDDYDTRQEGVSRGVFSSLQNTATFWNHQLGVVFKPASNGSVYLSTGTSSSPSGNTLGDGTENLAANNADLEPERDRTVELGTKWELANERLFLSTALFRTETDNARAEIASGLQETIGRERVDGFEIGLTGKLGDRWQLFGSLALLDSEVVDDGPVATNEGNQFPNTPKKSFSLWTTYAVSPRVTIGGGASYVDQRYGNVANTVWVPEYWRYDAMAAFSVGSRIGLQVNIQNLTDEVYYVRPYQAHYAALGAARSAVVSATLNF